MTSVFVYLSRLWGPQGLGGTVPSLCLRIQSMSQREVYRAAWKLGKTTQNSQDSTGGSFPSLNHKSDETALQNERKADSGRPEAASLLGIHSSAWLTATVCSHRAAPLSTFPDACLSHSPEGPWAFLVSPKSRSPPTPTLSLVWKLSPNSLRSHKITSLPSTLCHPFPAHLEETSLLTRACFCKNGIFNLPIKKICQWVRICLQQVCVFLDRACDIPF